MGSSGCNVFSLKVKVILLCSAWMPNQAVHGSFQGAFCRKLYRYCSQLLQYHFKSLAGDLVLTVAKARTNASASRYCLRDWGWALVYRLLSVYSEPSQADH
jgi:hypothetical protein